jgi:hypothetical protein
LPAAALTLASWIIDHHDTSRDHGFRTKPKT